MGEREHSQRRHRATERTKMMASRALFTRGLGAQAQQPLKNYAQRFMNHVTKRNMATDPGAPPKVNAWEAPTDIPSWKEEHIVIAVLSGWGVVIFGATKMFGGKKE